ncbi:MAG: hypothetical protein ACYTGX_07955, partial [Planctomycetota bacterium]
MRNPFIMGATTLAWAVLALTLPAAAQEAAPDTQEVPKAQAEPQAQPHPEPPDGHELHEPAPEPAGWFQNFNPEITLFGDILGRTSVGNNDLIVIGDEDEDG